MIRHITEGHDVTTTERAAKRAEREAQRARIEAGHAEARRIVATGRCPYCGSALRRNLSLSGWWQCEQLGAVTHRARPKDPPCDWQGFTS